MKLSYFAVSGTHAPRAIGLFKGEPGTIIGQFMDWNAIHVPSTS